MKTATWLAVGVLFSAVVADAQLLRYQFDEGIGNNAASSGSLPDALSLRDAGGNPTAALWGSPGSGVSGAPSDRALDLSTATGMGSGFVGPSGFVSSLSFPSTVNRFTITGWFRPQIADLGRATFLTMRNGTNSLSIVGLSGGPATARDRLRFTMSNGTTALVDGFGNYESRWSRAGDWAFVAITYDTQTPASPRLGFYVGNQGSATSLSTVSTVSSLSFPLGGASLWLGANASSSDPFQGMLDDFRLYNTALSLNDIEQIRRSAVPEPCTVAFLAIGGLTFIVKRNIRGLLRQESGTQ
jgi:hypothetical protein